MSFTALLLLALQAPCPNPDPNVPLSATPCSTVCPADFPPPFARSVECTSVYQAEMWELEQIRCKATMRLKLQFWDEVDRECYPSFREAVLCHPGLDTRPDFDRLAQCRRNVSLKYQLKLRRLKAIIVEEQGYARARLEGCT